MKYLIGGALALGLAGTAQAADDITLQLKWVTQAQFAGYYVALENGFYEEEDLNVTIKPGLTTKQRTMRPIDYVVEGNPAEVRREWLTNSGGPFIKKEARWPDRQGHD